MAVLTLSEAADLVTILGVLAAGASAVVAYREWRHRTSHWLYIPAPDVYSQNPEEPEFWVFPPKELEDGSFAVVVAGALMNAGPSDAYSVRIYADPELNWRVGFELVEETALIVAENSKATRAPHDIKLKLIETYKYQETLIPVLRVGQRQNFVVATQLNRGDEYLEQLLKLSATPQLSFPWETEDRRQAHGVHASSRTILGRQQVFSPADLCAPFEVVE